MVYLPTKLGHLWGFYVGKYTSTMDDLGYGESMNTKVIRNIYEEYSQHHVCWYVLVSQVGRSAIPQKRSFEYGPVT